MDQVLRRKQSFLLRLPPSLRESARQYALSQGLSLNYFIGLALAEKMARLECQPPRQLLPRDPAPLEPTLSQAHGRRQFETNNNLGLAIRL